MAAGLSAMAFQILSRTRCSSLAVRSPSGVTSYSRLDLPPRRAVASPIAERTKPLSSSRASAA